MGQMSIKEITWIAFAATIYRYSLTFDSQRLAAKKKIIADCEAI
jgi:hypothetical protein